jgi:MFS family permease
MFGMAGGSAGQFIVGPAISGGLGWDQFWWIMGIAGIPIAILLYMFIPKRKAPANPAGPKRNWLKDAGSAMWAVFRNPQSIICGLISGLLFIPTTIFDMVWGVRFLQEAHGMSYDVAVLRSAAVPFGWIIGCPLLGWISDKIGRRKPVIIGAAAVLLAAMAMGLYGPPGVLPPYSIALVMGIASGAAMIPYTIIKEANRPEHSGTATGVINFINFSFSALLGPMFAARLMRISGGDDRVLGDYQATFMPMLFGIGIAILLALLLRETGPRARATQPVGQPLTEAS